MCRYHLTSRLRQETGQAMAEFALVLPLLLLLLLGMVEFGRAFNYWNDANQLAADGARFAAVNRNPGASAQTLQQFIQSQADSAELRNGKSGGAIQSPVQVCIDFPSGGTPKIGDPVHIKVTAVYHWLPFLKFGQTTFAGGATMRLEQLPTNYSANPC
jgi:hypothetical protein